MARIDAYMHTGRFGHHIGCIFSERWSDGPCTHAVVGVGTPYGDYDGSGRGNSTKWRVAVTVLENRVPGTKVKILCKQETESWTHEEKVCGL